MRYGPTLPDYDVHEHDYSGTRESEWDAPRMAEFDTDVLSAIDDHFLPSASAFPPEAVVFEITVASDRSLVGTGVEESVAFEVTWRVEQAGAHDEIEIE